MSSAGSADDERKSKTDEVGGYYGNTVNTKPGSDSLGAAGARPTYINRFVYKPPEESI